MLHEDDTELKKTLKKILYKNRHQDSLACADLENSNELVRVKIQFGRQSQHEEWNIVRLTSPSGKEIKYLPKWDDVIDDSLKKATYNASRYKYAIDCTITKKAMHQALLLSKTNL